jgi:hypothetical protein
LAGFGGSLREKMLRDAKSLNREVLKPGRATRMMRMPTDQKAMAPQKIVEAAVSAALN